MILPKSGHVVVIDNDYNDAFPLLEELSKSGIFATYFKGDPEKLPSAPLPGISFIFLDMELIEGLEDPRTQATNDMTVVRKVVGDNPAPYFIIAWTDRPAILDELRRVLPAISYRPIEVFSIRKDQCKERDGSYSIALIEQNINERLEVIPSYQFITMWDSIASLAVNTITKDITPGLCADTNEWDKRLNSIFYYLAQASVGAENVKPTSVREGISVLCSMIFSEANPGNFSLPTQKLYNKGQLPPADAIQLALLNTKINVQPRLDSYIPGAVYRIDKSERILDWLLRDISHDRKHHTQDLDKTICIECEVTPPCDFAQNRATWKRFVPGILLPISMKDRLKQKNFIYLMRGYFYLSDLMDTPFVIAFDLRALSSREAANDDPRKPLFALRDSIYMHMLNSLANQVGNPGVVAVEA